MAGRGPQTFKKRQKEEQRREKRQEKLAKRLERRRETADQRPEEHEPVSLGSSIDQAATSEP
jgi:hypothetical protein